MVFTLIISCYIELQLLTDILMVGQRIRTPSCFFSQMNIGFLNQQHQEQKILSELEKVKNIKL